MKVSIGSKIINGPWGGGNLFVKNLSNYLIEKGHEVIYHLGDVNIDIILFTDPRSRKDSTSTFNHQDIEKYIKFVNNNVAVVQRINECDERKNTDFINQFYLQSTKVADKVVFVSSWLEKIYLNLGLDSKKTKVILSGSDSKIFNNENSSYWDGNEKIKLITHHWSSNHNKGFDTYLKINDLLNINKWKNILEFTYIGNISREYNLNNTTLINPLEGYELANEIKKNHIYITGSINEPSGNHHIEGAQCGLPLLYINSGGIPEYCDGFGESFTDDLESKLEKMINEYQVNKAKMEEYPFNAVKMCKNYLELFENLNNEKVVIKEKINKNSFLKYLIIFKFRIRYLFLDHIIYSIKEILNKQLKLKLNKNA